MHDVQHAKRSLEPEVPALSQILRSRRIERELTFGKSVIANAKLPHAKSAQYVGQPPKIVGVW